MEVYEAIRTRKSVRSYQDRPVAEEVLRRVLEAARLAPSASNRQEWRFVVATDAESRRLLAAAASQPFIARAPVVIACCAETDHRVMRCGQACYPIDVAIAVDHLTLAAVAEGLGSCWIGAFDGAKVREVLGVPEAIEVVELLALGYPADPAAVEKSRLPFERIVHFGAWQGGDR